jgi:hypothetical protein
MTKMLKMAVAAVTQKKNQKNPEIKKLLDLM